MPHVPEHYLQKVAALAMALPTINPGDAAIGVVTLGTLILWPRLGIRLPGHLPALLAGLRGDCWWLICSAAMSPQLARSSTISWQTALRATAFHKAAAAAGTPGICRVQTLP